MFEIAGGKSERAFANVYDALFAHLMMYGEVEGSVIYRGHLDARWQLEASYYRAVSQLSDYREDERHVIAGFYGVHVAPIDEANKGERQSFLQEFRLKYPEVDLADLTPLQQEAVVQHYLSGTKLLDFSRSVYVAAFFATGGCSSGSRPEMGAIYRIALGDLTSLGMGDFVEVQLPSRFDRIHRQKGLFLKIRFRTAINQPLLWNRWLFFHTDAANPFESRDHGVTSTLLLPKEIQGS